MKVLIFFASVFIIQSSLAILVDKNSTFSENRSLSRLYKNEYGRIEVNVKQKFTIELPLNISDGYSWCYWKRYGIKLVKFEESNNFGTYIKLYRSDTRKKRKVKLRQHFTFLPIKPGKAVLEFWYIQPWLNKVKHKYKILIQVNRI